MKSTFFKTALTGALLAGLAAAQTAPAPSNQTTPNRPWGHGRMMGRAMGQGAPGNMLDRLATRLQLTDAQKTQAQQIFDAAKPQVQALRSQERTAHQQLAAAIKNGGAAAEIDRLSAVIGNLSGQMTAVHAKSFAQFYSILTADQKAKVGDHLGMMMHAGFRRGAGRAPAAQ